MRIISKNASLVVTLILAVSMTIAIIPTQLVSAHTPAWQIPTYAFVAVAPNPVGVGQSIHVFMWLNVPHDAAAIANDYRFHNYQITVTSPDGQKSTTTYDTIQDTTSSQFLIMNFDKDAT
jgi:hypothetical protein